MNRHSKKKWHKFGKWQSGVFLWIWLWHRRFSHGFNIFAAIRGEFTVNGRIDIAQQKDTTTNDDTSFNSLKSQKYEVGDRVDFTFTLNFTGTQDLTSIDLFISGSSMRVRKVINILDN